MQRLTRFITSQPRETYLVLIITGIVSNWLVDPFFNDPLRIHGIHRLTSWFLLWWTSASGYFMMSAWRDVLNARRTRRS